jgi:hypothetical protein
MADLSKLADDLSRLTVLEAAELARLLEEKWQSPQARQSKVSFAAIKNDLPAWPDEVIKEWLLYLANRDDTGWPPPDPLGHHSWDPLRSQGCTRSVVAGGIDSVHFWRLN